MLLPEAVLLDARVFRTPIATSTTGDMIHYLVCPRLRQLVILSVDGPLGSCFLWVSCGLALASLLPPFSWDGP
eukprot:6279115-Pyramimonas_sp.AAC.1